jgi:DNA-binding transcriptional LysR family regulator
MTLTQLTYVIAVIEHGFSISKAAAALHTSQPGISRQIRVLEQQLGTLVFARARGRIVGLTQSGEFVAASAKRITKEAESLTLMGADFLHQVTGRLRIGTLHAVAISVLLQGIKSMRTRHPGVTIDVEQASGSRCFELLRAGNIDLGITIERPADSYRLVSLPFLKLSRILVVPRGHPLLKLKAVALADIARYPLICLNALANTSWLVARVFQAQGVPFEPAIRTMDAAVIKAYIEVGAGIAILSAGSFDTKRDRRLRAINVDHLFEPSEISLILDPTVYLRGYTYEFIESLAPAWTKKRIDDAILDTSRKFETA